MGEYTAGVATKNKILDVCRSLFYDYGIAETTYSMICEKAEINRGLLPYHFKSKDNIAFLIYQKFLSDFEAWVNSAADENDYILEFATSNFILQRFIFTDRKFMRFYCQLKNSNNLTDEMIAIQAKTIQKLYAACGKEITDESVMTLSCMYFGLEHALILNAYKGKITEDVDTIASKDILFCLSMIGLSTEKIAEVLNYSMAKSKHFSITMSDSFKYTFAPSGT